MIEETYFGSVDSDAMVWAFGDNWRSIPFGSMDDVWNKRHGNIFIMYGSDVIHESVSKLEKYYKENIVGA